MPDSGSAMDLFPLSRTINRMMNYFIYTTAKKNESIANPHPITTGNELGVG
jgi:hypothetical protein